MVILDLVVKSYWFDQIASGAKTSEYREIKPYWTAKFSAKDYTHVRFRRGYTNESMLFALEGIEVTERKTTWVCLGHMKSNSVQEFWRKHEHNCRIACQTERLCAEGDAGAVGAYQLMWYRRN